MIVNNFLSLDIELRILLLFFIVTIIYESIKGIRNKWQQKKQTKKPQVKKILKKRTCK
jgi:uncharacterized membrane protein